MVTEYPKTVSYTRNNTKKTQVLAFLTPTPLFKFAIKGNVLGKN